MDDLRVGDRVEWFGTEPATSTTPGNVGQRFEGVVEAVCFDPRGSGDVVAYLVHCNRLDSFICDVRPNQIRRVAVG
jgi:hypothetical protein